MSDLVPEIERSLCVVYQDDLKVLEIHSYVEDLEIDVFNMPRNLRLPSHLCFTRSVQFLCVYEGVFLILSFSLLVC